ncbi:MAG: hypothetical protein JOZ80_17765 [Acidobacteriaceae bacterium]|nr:hypothetical protein [Acidobacteriaceae bacterium]
MIPSLRKQFNQQFTAQKYQRLLNAIEARSGAPMQFRVSETPCFLPKELLDEMAQFGKELIQQLDTPQYRKASDAAIPPEFNVPNEAQHPMFVQVDFGLARDAAGRLQPKLVELQGFPSLYAYQAMLSQLYIEIFELDKDLRYLYAGLDGDAYKDLLSKAILAGHDPENVILMEIDPLHQKTRPDFLLTEKLLGIPTIAITEVQKHGRTLSYDRGGKQIPILRIYNRAIVDELIRKNIKLNFRFDEELDVEWAGHPNWYFRISKFSLPYLRHESVPKTKFLDRIEHIPHDFQNYVLKPLFSFAGLGVIIHPTTEDIAAIPPDQRSQYILQEKIHFEPMIDTPFGLTKAEIRMMYIWVDELLPVMSIVRMGRGAMMGVDHNKNMEWVGSSAALYQSKA